MLQPFRRHWFQSRPASSLSIMSADLENTAVISIFAVVILLSSINATTYASELVYRPINPSFGGNPLNGTVLLNNASSQNTIKDPDLEAELSALDDFNERLQRALLTRLTRTVTSSIIDDSGALIPGTTVTTDFIIDVIDEGGGNLSVTTTDRETGDQTVFFVESGS